MIEFLDGPAAGETLMLRRAPLLLRVVLSPRGKWDALDQLADVPGPDERLYAYHLISKPQPVHLKMNKGSGWYVMAQYRVVLVQPDDPVMRQIASWRRWCLEQKEIYRPAWQQAGLAAVDPLDQGEAESR